MIYRLAVAGALVSEVHAAFMLLTEVLHYYPVDRGRMCIWNIGVIIHNHEEKTQE
jgi:hypothetical protein